MRGAAKSGHRALGATVGAVWCGWLAAYKYPSFCHGVPSLRPPGTRTVPPDPRILEFIELGLAVNVDVVRSFLGSS